MGSLINLGYLMGLIIFVYAVLGVFLFGNIKVNYPMTHRLNFQNCFNAFVTLIRMCTGENWNELMNALGM